MAASSFVFVFALNDNRAEWVNERLLHSETVRIA
jgi:hypothetical protein